MKRRKNGKDLIRKAIVFVSITLAATIVWNPYGTNSVVAASYGVALNSGECGEEDGYGNRKYELTWTVYDSDSDSTGDTLVIGGSGNMDDYDATNTSGEYETTPWSSYYSTITKVVVEQGVKNVGYRAFDGASALTDVTLADTVTDIKYKAFANCTSLTAIKIPDYVTHFGMYAFTKSTNLCQVVFGEKSGLKTIDSYAFKGCEGLKEIILPDSLTTLGHYTFLECTGLESVYIPAGITAIESETFEGCTSLQNVTFAKNSQVSSIGRMAFNGCSSLKNIELPSTVTTIGEQSFYASGLTGIVIPVSVTSVGRKCFADCANLTSVTFAEGGQMKEIGAYAFLNCDSLETFEVPASVTTMGDGAVKMCDNLTTVIIHADSMESIGTDVPFGFCYKLSTVIYNSENSTATLTSLGVASAKTQMSYTENADGTVSITVVSLPTNETELSLPSGIDGKDISSVSFADGVDQDSVTIVCTKHTAVKVIKATMHGEICGICGEELEWEKHTYTTDGISCSCGYVKPFVISTQPVSSQLVYGEGVTLSVAATKNVEANLTYQWYENDKVIAGATASSYTVPFDKLVGNYIYRCKVSSDSYKIEGKAVSGSEYLVSETSKNVLVSIKKKPITLQINDMKKIEGKANPDVSYTVTGLVESDTLSSEEMMFTTTATKDSPAGTYPITATVTSDKYEVTVLPGTLTIQHNLSETIDGTGHGKACTVCGKKTDWEKHTFEEDETTCGCGFQKPFAITEQPVSGSLVYGEGMTLSVDTQVSEEGMELTYQWYENGNAIQGATASEYKIPDKKKAGEYSYGCKVSCSSYRINGVLENNSTYAYSETSTSAVVNIAKKKITVQIENKEKAEGEENPEFTYVIAQGQLLDGDTMADWKVKLSTAATKASLAGTYAITGTITSDNYEVTVLSGVLTVKEQAAPKKGEKVQDVQSKAIYQITKVGSASGQTGTVTYVKPLKKNVKKITIPATITINGIKYKVTGIAKKAFYNCKKLKTVKIGKNVTTIGDKAFYKCKALSSITIPSKVKKIGKSAFQGCKKLKTITIKTKSLKTSKVGKNAFKDIYKKAKIVVPKKKYKTYKSMLLKRGVSKQAKFKK